MALISNPLISTKVLIPFLSTLRTQYGHNCLGFINDSLYTEESEEACCPATLPAPQLLNYLGSVIHPTKSAFHPTQRLEVLRFPLDFTAMTVRLTPKNADKVVVLCQKAVRAQEFSIREIASLIGTLVSTYPWVELDPLYRHLEW